MSATYFCCDKAAPNNGHKTPALRYAYITSIKLMLCWGKGIMHKSEGIKSHSAIGLLNINLHITQLFTQ